MSDGRTSLAATLKRQISQQQAESTSARGRHSGKPIVSPCTPQIDAILELQIESAVVLLMLAICKGQYANAAHVEIEQVDQIDQSKKRGQLTTTMVDVCFLQPPCCNNLDTED